MDPEKFTADIAFAHCKAVFELLHSRGLSEEETYTICMLLVPIASKAGNIPQHATLKSVRGSFKVLEKMLENRTKH